jgi:chromosome segregation ATPase
MTADNLVHATNSMRSSVSSLKKKLSNLRVQVEYFDAEIEKIEGKFEKVLTQAEIYKSKLEREMGREVRRLERELALLRKSANGLVPVAEATDNEIKIASSVAILDSILRLTSDGADDFKLMSEAFLFPAVIERILSASEEAYFLEEVPASAETVIERGRQYVAWVRKEYDTHLTDPEAWDSAIDEVTDWWRNDALPLLYGSRDEQWDIDIPLTLTEMLTWRDVPAERPITYSAIFDAYEIYRKNKDLVYEKTGLRQFELKHFTFRP